MAQMLNVTYGRSKSSTNAMGMREMQARAYAARAAQFLLLKAPPAAGKSRALMFIALDKMRHQAREKTIVCVPETSIGGSFRSTDLTSSWVRGGLGGRGQVEPLPDRRMTHRISKVKAFVEFMNSDAEVLVCTHATFPICLRPRLIEEHGDRGL